MNKTIALAAIVMVAVIMGMSAFAPAAMGARDGPHGGAGYAVCHRGGVATPLDASDDEWVVLFVRSNALDGHLGHEDLPITPVTNLPTSVSKADCPNLVTDWFKG